MITAARPQVHVESVSWSAATFVAISQVGAEMAAAMIHRCTGILSYSQDVTGERIVHQGSAKVLTANSEVLHLYTFSRQD